MPHDLHDLHNQFTTFDELWCLNVFNDTGGVDQVREVIYYSPIVFSAAGEKLVTDDLSRPQGSV